MPQTKPSHLVSYIVWVATCEICNGWKLSEHGYRGIRESAEYPLAFYKFGNFTSIIEKLFMKRFNHRQLETMVVIWASCYQYKSVKYGIAILFSIKSNGRICTDFRKLEYLEDCI